ncbi:TetR/AcrR family transcriptional regulator [Sporolactobacillus sp. STSJ-5]|uniref:TetR/AcrR family transcriptional regulator n=1 Tax=Sporolactobacillus sp. STSJ-5 TaxID=2965076 RepID=UPI002107220C|nr:TetR/AcrR family transcriptional regulator [Sporolactobacillus sp. STSJ-5]MCQ2009751.1 TetR/AcrR family transcriptional regulator [Sporolactobacillus sp. STSJ-5]
MKRSERKNMMREHILRTAAELYLKVDPDTIKMRELAQTIGISSATLYNYFPSKDELSKAVVTRIFTEFYDSILGFLNDSTLTFPECLQGMQQFSKQALSHVNKKMIDLFFKMYQDNSEINLLFDSRSVFWRKFVARGRAEGYIDDDLSDTAVFIYIDMFFQYFRNRQYMEKFNMTPQSLQKIDHELDKMFYRGLLGINDSCIEVKKNSEKNLSN